MEKKVYYGEYTLYHWIELILKHNIVLPDYQRSFVWKQDDVERFINSLDGSFIPPVIIGAFKKGTKQNNLILDGQQRLTSLLLGYLGIYPKEGVFTKTIEPLYQDGNETAMDENSDVEVLEWTFDLLLHKHEIRDTRETVLQYVDLSKYDNLKNRLTDNFLKSHYLGFSFIVPSAEDEVEQQKFYSTVFRNINQQGVRLQGQESRRALYYLNSDLVAFFEPSCLNMVRVNQNGVEMHYDFVRSMTFLSQYAHENKETNIAKKCYRQDKLELLYEEYINDVVVDNASDRFGQFSALIGIKNLKTRFVELERCVREMNMSRHYSSIIDADVYMFGLIYYVVIKGYVLNVDRKEELTFALEARCASFKADESHKRMPNRVSHLRKRIKESISLYNEFANERV